MDEKTYLAERLENEIAWYERKSKKNKQNYYLFRIVEFFSAALIPFLINFLTGDSKLLIIAISILSITVLISTGIISLFQFNELWTEYRTNAESLKHEKYLYLSSAKPYNTENKFQILVERVERLISIENSRWEELSSIKQK